MSGSDDLVVPDQELRGLAQSLIDIPSYNPPGDVSAVMAFAREYLHARGIPVRSLDRGEGKVNLVAEVRGPATGPHLVLNAHLDVFPSGQNDRGETQDRDHEGEVRGRGAVDMKGGAAALMVVLALLHERRAELSGRVSLCLVCDEETFGPDGSRAVLDQWPDLAGDALLSAEPSSTSVIRVGERGFLWLEVLFRGEGGHGAYPSQRIGAIEAAAAFVVDVRAAFPGGVGRPEGTLDDLLAPQEKSFVDAVSMNLGRINGGSSVNMKATECRIELDFRLPIGTRTEDIMSKLAPLVADHGGELRVVNSGEPNQSDRDDPLFQLLSRAAEAVTGRAPALAIGLGCTDARLWRYAGVPAAVYGPSPATMATDEEWVGLDELSIVAQVHLRTAWAFLTGGGPAAKASPAAADLDEPRLRADEADGAG